MGNNIQKQLRGSHALRFLTTALLTLACVFAPYMLVHCFAAMPTREDRTVLAEMAKFQEMIDEQQRLERGCDAILLLDGWHESKGVRLELKTALDLGLGIYLEEDLDARGGRLCGRA